MCLIEANLNSAMERAQPINQVQPSDIIKGLKYAQSMSDAALASMRKLDQYSTALSSQHPSEEVRWQGAILRENFNQILQNQTIIMKELQKLEVAVKKDVGIYDWNSIPVNTAPSSQAVRNPSAKRPQPGKRRRPPSKENRKP